MKAVVLTGTEIMSVWVDIEGGGQMLMFANRITISEMERGFNDTLATVVDFFQGTTHLGKVWSHEVVVPILEDAEKCGVDMVPLSRTLVVGTGRYRVSTKFDSRLLRLE